METSNATNRNTPPGSEVVCSVDGREITRDQLLKLNQLHASGRMYHRLMKVAAMRCRGILGIPDDDSSIADIAQDIVYMGTKPMEAIRQIKKINGEVAP